jgi:two-component system, OmpR family, sensor histidine kinase MtrB
MATPGRHLGRSRRSLLRRVALIFMAAVAITALALALAAYFLTKSDQDARALSDALDQSRQNVTVADSMLPVDPGSSDYTDLMSAFQLRGDFDILMEIASETEPYVSGPNVTRAPITAELAAKVAEGRIGYQTVTVNGKATLVVGSQLRSGEVTVYFFYPQDERLAALAKLRNILIIAGVALAALGAIAGYFLARRLLRPVRAASKAAVQMSHGDLDIRLPAGPDEFGVLAASFNQMAENLQAKVLDLEAGQARERRFVADVTHELRTPVSALVGEASLLKARLETEPSQTSPEIKRLAVLVDYDIARLRQLVDDLLEISRLEAQAAETVIEPVELESFLKQLVRAHGWSDTVAVITPTEPAGEDEDAISIQGLVARADKRRLERIVVNLIENALRHGAAPVSIEARQRVMKAAQADCYVDVAVTDSGPGIPLEHLPHVFDRFYKADPSRSSSRGSGLGLAIARENARLLGGDVTAANVPGGGARFVVTLPAADL